MPDVRVDDETILATLEQFRLRLNADESAADGPFIAVFDELHRWIEQQHDTDAERVLEEGGYLARDIDFFARCQRRYLIAQEMAASAALLARTRYETRSVAAELRSEFGKEAYRRVADALDLASFAACRRFVMVGCGPLPAAALFIHDHTATPEIVALDTHPPAIEMAARLVAAFAPHRVRIVEGDGSLFDYADADIVYVANQVSPKKGVLQRIADTTGTRTQVLLRDPFGFGRLFAEAGVSNLDPRFVVARVGEGNRRFLSRHVLLTRR